jgi:branched-chain amino acid transport system substrate-binding protein
MKHAVLLVIIASLLLAGCGSSTDCTNSTECVSIDADEPVTIAVILTLTGVDSLYGIDALRGVEIAIADRGTLLDHPIQLVQQDDLCSARGGGGAAQRILKNPKIVGAIGASCSDASEAAAKIFSDGGLVMISPSSSAHSLTEDESHQEVFLRTTWNDDSQAKTVAEFAYKGLGARTMATIHYGDLYTGELQNEACAIFKGLGGQCVASYIIEEGMSPLGALTHIALFKPEVLYYPIHNTDGDEVTKMAATSGLENTALISSDRLLNTAFVTAAGDFSEGMYISGPAIGDVSSTFHEKYVSRYGEEPIAVYAAQAYDAAMILFDAIVRSAKVSGSKLLIRRGDLLDAVYATSNFPGISGVLTCSPLGDCAMPGLFVYQVRGGDFFPIYP